MTDHDTAAVSAAAAREQELAQNAYRLVRAVESGSGLVRARPEVLAELVELVDATAPPRGRIPPDPLDAADLRARIKAIIAYLED